jgi:hypothetical protein
MVSKQVFEEHFWACYNRFQKAATSEVGVPGYFRFLTLLGGRLLMAQHNSDPCTTCLQQSAAFKSGGPHLYTNMDVKP